jgi:hypothetical protein
LFAGLGLLWLGLVIVGILTTIFWIWMLVDCLTSDMASGEKLVWALVIVFLHFLGALIYYLVARQGHGGGRRLAV